jgi:AraC-like DNA-binding protein
MAAFSRNGSGGMGSPSVRWSLSGRRPDGARSLAARDADPAFPGSTHTTLASARGVTVHEVACHWEAGARMKERFSQFGLSLVRRGMFVRTTPRAEFLIDPTTAYFEQPGFEQQISHPRAAAGVTTVVLFSDDAMVRYAGDVTLPDVLIPIGPDVQLLHVDLVADVRAGIDRPELDARLTDLIGLLVERAAPGRLTARRPGTRAAHGRLVNLAREAIAADPASFDLGALAADLGCTPFHLSRVFHRMTGTTLTRYRNQVRATAVIDRVAAGEEKLADLAAELGFADHSHLVRVLRRAIGQPPSELRRRFRGARAVVDRNRTSRSKPYGNALP